MNLVQMRLTDLILDERCQMRVTFSEEYAAELAEYLEAGGSLPPLVAFRERPGPAILADGWHRRRAHEIRGAKYVEVDVRPGGLREATLHAAGCNSRSPLRPSREDFRKAVATLLLDPEWGLWSARAIATLTGAGVRLVNRLKHQLVELSDAGAQIGTDGVRVQRGGTTYTMHFRDMTPAQQAAAIQGETDACRPGWIAEAQDGLETARRALTCLGASHRPALGHVEAAVAAVRGLAD